MIRFMYTSKGHEFMKDKLLKAEQGITHSVFAEAGNAAAEEAPAEDAEEGADKPAKQ